MTEHINISDLQELIGKEVISFYLVAEMEVRDGKSGPFLRLRLQDRSGSLTGYVWKDAKKVAEGFSQGDVVKVKAVVNLYKEQVQLNVSQIRFADHSEYEIEQFIARSKKSPEILAEQFFYLCGQN